MVYRLIIEGWKQWNEKNYLNGQKKSMEQNRITRGMTGIVFCAIRTIKSALVIEVNAKKLGLQEDKTVDVLNIKCDPMMIGSLRMKEGFFPAYHMNKENWISILLDGTVSADEIKPLLELSYQLTR